MFSSLGTRQISSAGQDGSWTLSLAWPMLSQIIPCHFNNKKLEENYQNLLPIYMFEQILWPLLLVYAYYALGCTWWVTAGVWAHSPCTIYIFKPFSAYQEAEEILWLQNGCLTFKSYHMPHEILSHGQGRTCLLALLRGNRDVWQSTYQKKSLPKEIPINQGGKKCDTKKTREKKKMMLVQEN